MSEPNVHFLPGGNVIAEVSGNVTKETVKQVADAVKRRNRQLEPKTYVNSRTGKKYKRTYKLTSEQHAKVMAMINGLLDLADEYEIPVYVAVQTSFNLRNRSGTVAGGHNIIPPRTSYAFDLAQSVSNLICNGGITDEEFRKLYDLVGSILHEQLGDRQEKADKTPETAL